MDVSEDTGTAATSSSSVVSNSNWELFDDTLFVSPQKGLRSANYKSPLTERLLLVIATDLACAVMACTISFLLWHWNAHGTVAGAINTLIAKWHWFPLVVATWMSLGWLFDLYDHVGDEASHLLAIKIGSIGIASLVVGMAAYFFVPDYAPRFFVLSFIVTMGLLTGVFRTLHSHIGENIWGPHRLLLIGDRAAALELKNVLKTVRTPQFQLLGCIDESVLARHAFMTNGEDLLSAVRENHVHEIVVSSSMKSVGPEVLRSLVACQCDGIRVSSLADLYRKASRQIPIKYIERDWVLTTFQDHPLFTRVQLGIKRAVDILGACLAMPVFLLIFIPVAIAIRWNSAGPIFYRQIRSGRGGKPFSIWKFRTMGVDAEKDGVARWANENDVRVTRVGKILRMTRIDELPQILNVLRGEMSLVGPRPERPELEATLELDLPHYSIKHLVKPGVTGWAQIHYKYGNTVDDSLRKLQYDFYYIKYWSLLLDFYVIFRTVGVVVGFKGL